MKFSPILAGSASLVAIALAGALTLAPAVADDAAETRNVPEFSKILIQGALELNVTVGGPQSVEITADEEYIQKVETSVDGDTLVIEMKKGRWRKDTDVVANITVAELNSLHIEGAADATLTGVDSENFAITIDGAGDIDISGRCISAEFEINGAGDLDAEEFECENVEITLNGAGDADVFASKRVVAAINGVGDIDVYGKPSDVRPRIAGIGDFEVK